MQPPSAPIEPDWDFVPWISADQLRLTERAQGQSSNSVAVINNSKICFDVTNSMICFNISMEGWSQIHSFELLHEEHRGLTRYYFKCLVTGEKLTKLFLHEGALVSKQACRRLWYRRQLEEQHSRNRAVAALMKREGAVKGPRARFQNDLRRVGRGRTRTLKSCSMR